jgi:hypothetical protein
MLVVRLTRFLELNPSESVRGTTYIDIYPNVLISLSLAHFFALLTSSSSVTATNGFSPAPSPPAGT